MKKDRLSLAANLVTPFEKDALTDCPYNIHPRPQMRRRDYMSLNGKWSLTIDGKKRRFSGDIIVPYPPESKLSGVMTPISPDEKLHYSRTFYLPENFAGKRIILHFDAVDQVCKIYLNGIGIGVHVGGYLPFSFDITDLVREGENKLSVIVRDPLDKTLPYGKQSSTPGGMWYPPVSGIWQSVWLEAVPQIYVKSMRMTPSLDSVKITVDGGVSEKHMTITTPCGVVEHSFSGNSTEITFDAPRLWTPDDPYLYRFTLKCGYDEIESYFALRTFGVTEVDGVSYLALNGKPCFLHGVLDQGYFSDGIFLPATPEGYENDILKMKACGFNMLRKHIKLEPDVFYYYCDLHGIIVCQDMINNGEYSFIRDTALPTLGIRRGINRRSGKAERDTFIETSRGIIAHLYNHPSVCYYTIFNEGWGQFEPDLVYEVLKAEDETRVYDTTSGWFKGELSDVESDHVYFKPINLKRVDGRPMVLSEFGGYACKIEGHVFNPDRSYGYRKCATTEVLQEDILRLYRDEVLPHVKRGLSCAVLTQLSDVEDEINGLLTYDRQVLKVDVWKMNEMARELYSVFSEASGGSGEV